MLLKKNKKKHVHITDFCIGNNVITRAGRNCVEEYVCFLEVLIDDGLSFVGYINKPNCGLYALLTCKNLVPLNKILLIYRGLIDSHLQFGSIIYGAANPKLVEPIQILHFVYWQWPNTMPTLILFSQCTTFLSYQI